MGLKQKILEKAKTIRGNELSWLIQLAESHLDSKTFQDYLTKNNLEPTRQFLNRLLADFHPNNFYTGRSDTEWLLTKKDVVVAVLDEAIKEFPLPSNFDGSCVDYSIAVVDWFHKYLAKEKPCAKGVASVLDGAKSE